VSDQDGKVLERAAGQFTYEFVADASGDFLSFVRVVRDTGTPFDICDPAVLRAIAG
jgi:hypothetical protein